MIARILGGRNFFVEDDSDAESDAESDFGWCEGEVYYDPEDDDLCFE